MCTLHNILATTLIQYEAILIRQLKERMDKTLNVLMTSPLLRLEDNESPGNKNTEITVNSDNGLVLCMHILSGPLLIVHNVHVLYVLLVHVHFQKYLEHL